MVLDRHAVEGGPKINSIRVVADSLGVGEETLHVWVSRRQLGVNGPPSPGDTADDEVKRLRRENAELRRANEILKKALAFFALTVTTPNSATASCTTKPMLRA